MTLAFAAFTRRGEDLARRLAEERRLMDVQIAAKEEKLQKEIEEL